MSLAGSVSLASVNEAGQHLAQGFHQARGEAIRRARAREPRACVGSLVDFHARAFVFALDNFAKMIAQLALVAGDASGVPPKLAKVGKSFDKAFPGAKDVRDSLHHLEDRLLRLKGAGKELKKKKLVPIRGPLVVGQVSGDDYAMTTADGVEGIVTINPASLAELKAHLDSTLAAFTWLGEPLDMMKW